MRGLAERIVRWYFKRYHPNKVVTLTFISEIYEFGDVLVDHKDKHVLYLGKAVYIKLHK